MSSEKNFNYSDSLQKSTDSVDRVSILKTGKELYGEKCKKCHTLYKPKDFSVKVWKENLDEMKEKAGLSDSDYYYIYEYLSENAKKKK
jgi:hypothetical protein